MGRIRLTEGPFAGLPVVEIESETPEPEADVDESNEVIPEPSFLELLQSDS